MAGVELLYKNYGILADAADTAGEHPEAFQSFLDATKATLPEKKLACQFIPKFFIHFPSLADAAIDAQLDLCEDEDTPIRCQAIKSLPDFCKDSGDHIPRITDILTQLLQQEDTAEVSIVRKGLEVLIKKNAQAALGGIFSQILLGDDLVREKAIAFLSHVVTTGEVFKNDKQAGMFLLSEVQKVLSDVTGDEFTIFISILSKVKSIASNPQNLADLITEQAELDKEFQPSEPEILDRLITCTQQAAPFFAKGASPVKYLEYLFKNVLPVLSDIVTTEAGDYRYGVLKLIAELSTHATVDNAKEYFETVYKKLIEYMPLPGDGIIEPEEELSVDKLNFSFVECLIYTLHKLGSKSNEYFSSEHSASALKEFRQRLQYFGRMTQVYIKQLKAALQDKTTSDLETVPENKIKVAALVTCNNITIMIKDLLHNPPSYRSRVTVSWKAKNTATAIERPDESVEDKRKRAGITPISMDNLAPKRPNPGTPRGRGGANGNTPKSGGKLYSLPSERKGVQMDEEYSGRQNRGYYNNRGGGNRRRSGGGRGRGRQQETYENFLFR